ncbi:uncharacterized protein LOC108910422 [Anoplophora glabripennis]|uniref:uncharacterized protein LOC108910422 n=1 Tax=Anoplophora glabripennis TaxID=217634 RepID=UPI0008754CA2|nr:uncharacterized protein LOC108910422 [Anoplophora glabripennis]
MVSKCAVLVLVVLYSFIPSTSRECVANHVLNLRVAANAVLSWEIDPNDPCEIDEFQVDVLGDRDEYHFKVRDTEVDFSFFLLPCEELIFVVTPISNGTLGVARRLTQSIPLPPNADISLRYFNLTEIDSRDILLEWTLMNHTYGACTLKYRFTVEDLDNGYIEEFNVTRPSVNLYTLSPCVPYHFTVGAINWAYPTIEGPMRFLDHEIKPTIEGAPTLETIEIGATEVNMTWRLENPGSNRCPIRTLYVDAGSNFNISLPLVDTPERPPVEVNLRGLYPDTMYFLKISVENSGGISRPAQLGVQTLELSPGSG